MELFILIIILLILAETTTLLIRNFLKNPITKNGRPRRKVFVDTSALIDGRILNVAKTGFIADDFIITRSVLHELQLLADSKSSEKRTRARLGFETAKELERVVYLDVTIYEDALDHTPVDDRLIDLAKENPGSAICTTDFNLGKVAEAAHIDVLNVNDLALSFKDAFKKGQRFPIKIVEKGSNRGQGVGHLDDGSMVVVDKASNKIGQDVEVEVIRFVQNSAGRIVFTKLV
ncbi:TRAM domain-containing protein [Candidatus Saccharibacteria bacterium]|nr:TRAM domain-containing protein [Candidatus Saccharibacteria bacterium]